MEEKTAKEKKFNIIRVCIMLFLTVAVIIPIVSSTNVDYVDSKSKTLDAGWTVTHNDKVYENVTLSEQQFEMCNKGDILILETVLPERVDIVQPTLRFYSVHSAVTMFLDGERIYSYGRYEYNKGKMLGYGYHFIPLPDGYEGKHLKIVLNISEDNAFDGQQALTIDEGNSFLIKDFAGKRFGIAVSWFLIVFGMLTMILSIIMMRGTANFVQTFCIAMFSFLVGVWSMCNSDTIIYLTTDLKVKAYFEYMTFYSMALPITYYFRDKVMEPHIPKWIKRYFYLLIGYEIIYIIVTYGCQLFNLAHFPMFLIGTHICMGFVLILIMLLNFYNSKSGHKKENTVTIGFAIAAAFVLVELIRFNFSKFFIGFTNNKYSSTVPIAVFIIVVALLVDYGKSISSFMYRSAQQQVLEHMAYVDELTGLYNRRKFEETLSEVDQKGGSYVIMSFDLNYLKRINDTYGHEKGDALIRRFADVLLAVYSLYGVVSRTGGDEFVAVLFDVTKTDIDKMIVQMNKLMDENNSSDDIIQLSTAYGVAFSEEYGDMRDSHFVYKIADDRMYENKRKSKKGRE